MSELAGGLATGLSVFLVGLAVKAVDDLLDEPEGFARGAGSWVALSPYVALALVVAAGLAPAAAVSLFLAAYAIGMAPSPFAGQPSGLPSWGESVICVGLGALFAGPIEALGSVLLVASVQALDDFADLAIDRASGRANIALAVGRWPALALAALLWVAALALSPSKALSGLAVMALLVVVPAVASLYASRAGVGEAELPAAGGPLAGVRGTGLLPAVGGAALAGLLGLAGAALGPGLIRSGSRHGPGIPAGPPSSSTHGVVGAGVEGWSLFLLGLAACAAVTGGLVLAYRRGLQEGRRKGSLAEQALSALRERADTLDGAGRPE